MARRSFVVSAVLLILFFIAISEIAEAKLCETHSKTYSGKCDNKECDKKCIEWEKQEHGACHKVEGKNTCFCYSECSKTPPTKDKKPAPPDALKPPPTDGGSPPADGGSPPPPAEGGDGGGEGGGEGGGDGGGAPPAH
ncbi:major pollen allergen Art v 1-like [Rutidosis leptorrhynchoides]|uniref:major pollen allergen Art v 1-like n=1 Tax=Rutidosis leptorrhynchoides TaxID=125765 RepID=UPI003A98F125